MKMNINDTTTQLIYSKKTWNITDIEIRKDEEYIFEAVGFWKDLLIICDADGYKSLYMSLFNRWKRSRPNNWFALMGSINQIDDFLIGKNIQMVFHKSGKLFCYANDVRGFYWNNSRHLSLKITRIK